MTDNRQDEDAINADHCDELHIGRTVEGCPQCALETQERLHPHGVLSPDVTCDADFPHARAFGESLGAKLAQCLPSIGTWTVGNAAPVYKYRATFAHGAVACNGFGLTAPIHAELQATIYARDDVDAERCAEHIARDRVDYLIACSRVEER